MAYSAATRAFKAINSARDDIEKRRKEEGESFTYEPWAVPSEEEQSIRAAQVNQRYADIVQNGPDAAAIAGREAMKNLQAQQKYLQYQREMEEQRNNRLLQNGFTQGDINAYQDYKNASAGIQSGLQNIADIQQNTLTGFDRRVGNTTGTFSATRAANQFKQENNLDDEAYNRLMAGYKTYRAKQSLAAEDSYSGITDEQKNELSQIGKMQNTKGLLNDITGKAMRNRREAKDLSNQFKQKYGVDDATYSTWQGMNDQEDTEKEEAQNTRISASRASRISSDEINKLDRESRSAIDQYMKGYKQSQTSAGTGSLFENLKGQFSLPSTQMKGIFEGRQMMENARQRLRTLGYSESDIKKYEEYAQVYAEDSLMAKDQKEAQNHPLSSNANAVLTDATLGMVTGLSQFGQDTADQAYQIATGNRAKNNSPNNFGVGHGNGARAARYSSNVQEGTQKAILNGNEENPSLAQKVGKQLYTMGYSAAQSHLTNIVGALGSAALGSNVAGELVSLVPAFGNSYYQGKINAEERGLTNDKAYQTAFAEARHEVETETLSDRILGTLFKEDSIKNILKETLKGSAEEGGEEIANNILNAITDQIINGDKSELNQSVQNYVAQGASQKDAIVQTAVDFIQQSASDFLNAAGSTLIGMGPNFAARTIENRTSGNELFKNYTAQDYRDLQDSYDLDQSKASYPLVKKASDLASQYAEKLDKGEKVTTRDRAKLWDTTSEIAGAEQTAAENRERDEKKKKLKEDIKWGFREAFGRNKATEGQQAAEQTNTEESTDTQKTAAVEPQNVPEEHRTQSTDIEPNDAYAKMAAAQNGEELRNAYQEAVHSTNEETRERADSDLQIVSGMLQKRGISAEEIESAKISTEDAYAAGYSGQEISENVPATVKIAYNDGQKQAIEDRARQTLEARDSVKRTAAKQITDGARTIIEANYKDGMNASAYNDVMSSAINAGRTGMSYENYLKKAGSSVSIVGEDLAKKAYAAGLQVSVNDAVKEFARSMSEKTGVKTFGTGTFTDARSDTSEPFNGSSVMQAVARMTGLNVVLTDQNFREGENGYYKSGNSTIYINSEHAENAASTLFHEVGEFSSVWNQKEYAGVVSDIMKASQNVLGTRTFNNIRQKYVNAYLGEEGKTDADVDKEMANDLIYQFLGNEKGMNKLMDQIDQNHGYKEAKSIKQKLADWVGHMVESIKNFLSDLNPNSYQRKMAEANLQNYEELQDAIVKSIANAEKSYSEAKAQSQKTVATDESAKRKSIEVLPDTINDDIEDNIRNFGDMKPVIDVPNNAFERGEKKLSEQVKEYFLGNSDNGIVYGNVIGDVDIVAGIKSDIAHGVGRMKAMAFYAVPETIKKGVIVDYQKNRKQRGYDSLLLAAPIRIQNEAGDFENAVEMVAINRSNTDVQKFYFHEAFIINEDESLFKNGRPNRSLPVNNSSSSVYSIAQRLIRGNGEGNSVNIDSDTKLMSKQIQGENGEILYGGKAVGTEDESSGEKRFSLNTYEHGGKQYLENFLNNTDDLTDAQKEDILAHMEFAYNLAKDLSKNNRFAYFGQWSKTGLAKTDSGVPLLEVRSGNDGKPIRSVAVNNGEYPLNIDFSQVCKKRSTLNAVLNYMVKNYGMNLRTLTASDVININQAIKNHGFEIACGLCFVDAKRYRTGAWASTFAEGTKNKKGELNANQPGYNNLVRMIVPKDKSNDVGYSYFNFATDIPSASARTIDQLSDDELDFTKIEKKLGRYAKYDEEGNIVGIGGYRDKSGRTKNPTETIRLAWAIYSNPEMRHLISEEDLISSDGLDAMRDQNGQLYSLVNAHWGAGKPKLSHGGTAYGNEILRSAEWGAKNDFNPESAAKVGGVRVQSFSDYEANMFFDYMQLFADMSARKLTSHAYTKEPYYAKLFGMTGQKINLSIVAKAADLTEEQQARYEKLVNKGDKYLLNDPEFKEIAEHAGLAKDKDGNWTVPLVEDETFPLQEALALQKDPRYSSNCGIIWIGISDAQIRVLLDSDDVPMIIPYHSSGVSRIVKKERNLLLYKDYTNQQNTRTKDGKKITGKDFDFYGSLAKTNDVIKTTEEYKAWCEKNGYLPKFDTFKDHPNYYKLLIDFRAYDYNGIDPEKMAHRKYQPQGIVQMKFPDNLAELVTESLAEQQETKDLEAKEFTDAQGSLLNDVKEILGLGDVRSSKNIDEDVDIRRDIGVDDYVTDQELWSGHYDTKKSLIEVLRSGNEILKNSDIDKTAVRRIAREIKDQYHSNIDVNELAENLEKVFRYAQGQNYIDYDDLATVISEVASPVIDGSVTKVGAEEFKQFKNALQGVTYNLDSKQEAEVISAFGSWGNFRKAIPGVKFTRDGSGVSLDGVWNTLVQETGYVLDMDTSSNDMPLALVDAYNSMKPEYQNAFGEDATQAAQDAAMEIVARYYQYSAGQEKLKLKAKQKQELLDQARRMAASNAEYRKKIKQEYQKRYEEELSKVRQSGGRSETVSKQVARLRAKNARTVASIREQQKRKDELRMLKTPVKNLMDMLTGPTDKKHVPALVQTPVLQLASAFDFVPQTVRETADGKFSIRILESRDINADGSYSYKWRTIHADSRADAIAQYKKAMEENGLGSAENKSWQESLRAIQDLYQQDEGDDWFERSELKQGLDKELGEKLGEILRKNQGTISIAQLSSDELKTLNAVVRNVLHSINQMNRMYSQPSQQVSDIAHMAMDRTTSGVKGRREHFKPVASLVNTLTLDHASPETYFHGIFGGENTDPVTKTLIGAQNKKARDVRQASEYMEDVRDKVGVKPKDLESWMKETKNYYGLNLTTTQVMSLYELSKRPDAQQHKVGGFVADEASRKTVSGQRLPVQLTDAQIKAITDTLTQQQKQMADAMQYYLAHQCAEQGNETCMQLYGYEKFVDEHYFPMTTDKNTIATRDSNVTQGAINAIKNSGFTKDITPNASNPLVLRDIFAVYSDHVAQMATYHAWAAPIQDIIRFFNYSEKTDVKVDGQTFTGRNSVKDAIDFFYGKSGQEYFVKLLSSINDREKSSFVGGDFYDLMTGHAKTAAVMGNLRVVIQQPTAIFRAGEMISYKYLNEGMAGKYRKEAAELRDRTSDVFWLKNQGNIDGYITQSLVSTITGVKTTREKINDFAGKAASKADEITWGAMYRAVYAEQVDKLGKEKIGTKEFEDAVNERFSEIVLRTQVYDGIITRSQFMRSPDKANRMMSAFMAEPVKTYNMILRDMIDISQATDERQVKKAVAHLVRITAPVLLITNAVNAVAQSFADALRSAGDPDDEDKDFLRRFMDALGFGNWLDEDASFSDKAWEFLSGNLVDNMDLLSNIPMVAQYWDATKEGVMSVLGESTYSSDSDLSMSGVKNFFKAVKAIVNPSEKMTTYGKVAALTRAFSDLSGYPLYAAQRDVVAIYNTVASEIFKQLPVLQKTTKYTPKKQAKLDVYTAALESGGDYKKAVEDAVAQGNDYKAISSGISDTYKDTYLALKETNPNEAIKMKNRLVTLYVYLSDKAGTNKDKTTSEKTKYYSDNIDKWK